MYIVHTYILIIIFIHLKTENKNNKKQQNKNLKNIETRQNDERSNIKIELIFVF